MKPSCGCCQRTSASTPKICARLQVDFRLVDNAQLVARNGVPEIAHQREALGAVAIELRRIDHAAGAIFLGDVHRDVGALHEHFGLGAMLGRDRNADAAVHVEVQPFDGERLLHGRNQLARGQLGAGLSDAGQHDGELVAAEARDRIRFAQLELQPMPDLAQHGITHQMPHRVVDLLEPVEVHDQHRQRIARAQRIGDRHLEPVLEQRPVRQIGQAVVVREMADALFGFRSLAPHFGVAQLAVDGGNQPVEVVLDDVVVGAVLHRVDGDLFADRAGHENERHFEAAVAHHREGRGAAEARHRVIGDHEIPVVLSSAAVSAFSVSTRV